jgi:O-antigen/teichoic acid export membrane protein
MAGPEAALAGEATGQPVDGLPKPKSSLADRIGMVVGGQFVGAVIGLVQGILLVRLLSKSDYGTFALVMTLFGTGRDLGMLYVPESVLYFAPKVSRGEFVGLVRQSMLLLVVLGALSGLGLAALSHWPHVFLGGRDDMTSLLLIGGLTLFVTFPSSIYGNTFIATDNHRPAAGISLLMTVLGAAGALIPAALGWPLSSLLVIMAANTLLRWILCERLFRQLFAGIEPKPLPGGIRAQLRYVLPLAFTRFAGLFNQKLDKFVVGLFFAADAYAEFSLGSQELPLVSVLPYTIASTMMPKLVEVFETGASRAEGAKSAIELWHAGIRKATVVMVPVAVFLLCVAEPLITLLYGERYRAAAVPFRIYGVLLLARVTSYGTMLMVLGRTPDVMRIQVGGMVFNVVANLLLMPRIGMIAAPLSAVLTQLGMIVAILVRVNHVARVGALRIFPWGHWLRALLAAGLAAGPLLGASLLVRHLHPALFLALGAPIFLGVYIAIASAFRVLMPEDRAYVARWLRLEPLRKTPKA